LRSGELLRMPMVTLDRDLPREVCHPLTPSLEI
jgi:hypothetical protein